LGSALLALAFAGGLAAAFSAGFTGTDPNFFTASGFVEAVSAAGF